MRIAVVGAGLAGLSFAHFLHHDAEAILFEKSRGVGGRLATRRNGDSQFDHGAQFFTCRSDMLQSLVEDTDYSPHVGVWEPKILTLQPGEKPFKRSWFEPHYVGMPSMTALPKRLAQDVSVQLSTRVERIVKADALWRVYSDDGRELGAFDWVVAAMPAAQTGELLQDQFSRHADVETAVMSPCFALMIKLAANPDLNFDAAVVRDSPIAWIANNGSKPGRSPAAALLVHSCNNWASEHLEDPVAEVETALLDTLFDLVPLQHADILEVSLHRWRYAKVEQEVGADFLIDESAQLAAIGDWCRGNRAEDAFLSGAALARHLHALALGN